MKIFTKKALSGAIAIALLGMMGTAGAVVNRNVLDYALMAGVPARHIGWMSEYGERLDLPLEGDAEAICGATGARYLLRDGHVSAV